MEKQTDKPSALKDWVRALEMTASIGRAPTRTLPIVVDELAVRFGDAPALIDDDGTVTYRELAARANRYARWARAAGIAPGESVGLLMANRCDYLALWLGLARAGAAVALINTNLVGDSLAHSLGVVSPTRVIVGAEFGDAYEGVRARLGAEVEAWAHGDGVEGAASGARAAMPRIDAAAAELAGEPLEAAECPLPTLRNRALCIYTSGTTGLPKAANVSHYRVMQWSHWFAGLAHTSPADRVYNCLPMYHSVGGVVAVGAALVTGGSVVIRPRFSASAFWDEVVAFDCTLFQYIGELCRYLVNSPAHPREREHRLRLACGNGLRPDVWGPFKERFGIPRILEFYAATEANFSLYNCEGKPGAIGRIPSFLAHRVKVALVKLDLETGEPVRGDDGLCMKCEADEPGEAISPIAGDAADGGRFEGYTDEGASAKKVLRNVFAAGDAWYRSGDLMRRDRAGYFYFVDRVGATFRWKGENVSTAEVAEALCACPGVAEAVVFGVEVPGADGRAGMAAMVLEDGFDFGVLRAELARRLPEYARPLFVRILSRMEATGTFKPRTQEYVRAGYDPRATEDALYVDDAGHGAYLRLDAALYEKIRTEGLPKKGPKKGSEPFFGEKGL